MKNRLFLILSFLISLFCIQCKTKISQEEYARVIKTVDSFSDTIFYGWIRDIEIHNDTLYFADQATNQIIVADNDLNFIRKVGKAGPGPEEISGLENVEVTDQYIFSYDIRKGKANQYTHTGEFVNSFDFIPGRSEFVILDDKIISSYSYEPGRPPLRIGKIGVDTIVEYFGKIPDERLLQPKIHVVNTADNLVSVYVENSLIVDIYDRKKTLLNSYNLSEWDELNDWIEGLRIEQMLMSSKGNTRNAQVLCWDVYSTNSRIYLLTPVRIVEKKRLPIIVISFGINHHGEIIDKKAHPLQDGAEGSFYSLAVTSDDQTLFAYDPGSGLVKKFALK